MAVPSRGSNRLFIARKRQGLGQKQVAILLGHRNANQVSRFERGSRLPSIETALKLEIIYKMSVSSLFFGLENSCFDKIDKAKKRLRSGKFADRSSTDGARSAEICTYAEKLKTRRVADEDLESVRKHITNLVHARSEVMNSEHL